MDLNVFLVLVRVFVNEENFFGFTFRTVGQGIFRVWFSILDNMSDHRLGLVINLCP